MKKYLIYCPELGEEAKDVVKIKADCAGKAAEIWAENWDRENYRELAESAPLEIRIRQNRKGSKEQTFQVTAKSYYTYNAYSLD